MDYLRRLFFSIWYYRRPPWDTGISPPELIRYLDDHPPGRALDLGCGTGTNVITMAERGWQATGVDFARRAINTAKKKAHQAGVEVDVFVDDITRLTRLDGPYDLILDIGCYHSLPQKSRGAAIDNVKRLLASDGTYLMYAFCKGDTSSGTGLSYWDMEILSEYFNLDKREEGMERDHRPSVWLWFHH